VKLVDLKEGNSKIFLHIIGDGELRNSLQTLALKLGIRVKFYGWQANVVSLIAQMDCVIITSDNEGTPISLIEAGLLKKPTISTNVGSVNEVIIHEVTGLICNLDPEDISGAILKIMNNNELALKYGTAAQQYLTKEFSVRQFVSSHESLYEFVFDSITP
jgi:glycosyltransferase involved in cell wall biosynthesis